MNEKKTAEESIKKEKVWQSKTECTNVIEPQKLIPHVIYTSSRLLKQKRGIPTAHVTVSLLLSMSSKRYLCTKMIQTIKTLKSKLSHFTISMKYLHKSSHI